MITYKIQIDTLNNQPCAVLRSDGWSIPFDQDNTSYQAYLEWLAEGNEPEPAEVTI